MRKMPCIKIQENLMPRPSDNNTFACLEPLGIVLVCRGEDCDTLTFLFIISTHKYRKHNTWQRLHDINIINTNDAAHINHSHLNIMARELGFYIHYGHL